MVTKGLGLGAACLIVLCACGAPDDNSESEERKTVSTPPTERSASTTVHLSIAGDEYEASDGTPLNGSAGTHCPPTREVVLPSQPKCWTWSTDGLGSGTV